MTHSTSLTHSTAHRPYRPGTRRAPQHPRPWGLCSRCPAPPQCYLATSCSHPVPMETLWGQGPVHQLVVAATQEAAAAPGPGFLHPVLSCTGPPNPQSPEDRDHV